MGWMKKYIFLLLTVAIIMVVFVINNTHAQQDPNVIYVAINGDDHNPGTKTEPYQSLDKAASEAEPGTTVLIREGTYHEKLKIQHSGTEENPITFKPYEQEKVVLSGKDIKDIEEDTSMVTIKDKSYVTISGLTIQDLQTDSTATVIGIYVTGSSSHITLENNHVRRIETNAEDGNAHGIAVYGTEAMTDINILKNKVEELKLGSSESVVLNGNIDGFTVEDNLVRRNDNIGIDLIGHEGTANDPEADYVRNGVVKNNEIYEISSYGNPAYGEDYSAGGIYVDGGKNITIEQNTIYQSDIGIEATSEHANQYADNIRIINNIVYENFYTGISIGGYDKLRGGTIHSTITGNVLYRNDTKGLGGGQLQLQHDTKNNVIEKNILTAGPSRIFIANYFSTNEDNQLIKNVFHKEEGKDGIWIWKEQEYISFAAFQKASNSDENSAYLDPMFVDEEQYDFRLEEDSPARRIIE